MKITRLEWRYLQKIALDHPYFDTHKLPLTEKEAKAIVEANNRMTGKEFVDSIYAKLGIPRPQEEKKRSAWLRNLGELFTVPPIRKIAIAVLIVVLLVTFFAATPTGRAIAESVIQYIATLFEDGYLIIERNNREMTLVVVDTKDPSNEIESHDNESNNVYINSFDDFEKATNRIPVVLTLPCKQLYYDYDRSIDLLTLYAEYETPLDNIVTIQNWSVNEAILSTNTGYQKFDKDKSIYYSYENEGYISISKVFNDSYIIIISTNGAYSPEELVKMLEGE